VDQKMKKILVVFMVTLFSTVLFAYELNVGKLNVLNEPCKTKDPRGYCLNIKTDVKGLNIKNNYDALDVQYQNGFGYIVRSSSGGTETAGINGSSMIFYKDGVKPLDYKFERKNVTYEIEIKQSGNDPVRYNPEKDKLCATYNKDNTRINTWVTGTKNLSFQVLTDLDLDKLNLNLSAQDKHKKNTVDTGHPILKRSQGVYLMTVSASTNKIYLDNHEIYSVPRGEELIPQDFYILNLKWGAECNN
jgi:hypothetical protein